MQKKRNKLFYGAFVLALALCFLGKAPQAFAHATPVIYEPAASSILEKLPERIRIQFSERVEPNASGITVYAPDGSRADMGEAALDPSDSHFYGTMLKGNATGTYTVSWQVISADDGHFTKGAFVFSVGKETAVASSASQNQFQIDHSSALPEGTTIWFELMGHAFLFAALILYYFLWRPKRKLLSHDVEETTAAVHRRFTALIIVGLLLTLAGTLPYLIFKGMETQQLQTVTFLKGFFTFSATVAGTYTWYKIALAALFGIIFFAARNKIFRSETITKSAVILFTLLVLMALARARVSHAAASHFLPGFSVFVNFVHLMFKDLWVGGLIAFAMLLVPIMKRGTHLLFNASASISFSKLMSIAFGGAGITGAYIVWLHLKDPGNLLTTDWGVRFIVLLVLGGLLFLLRLYHQFIVDPARVALLEHKADSKARSLVTSSRIAFPLEQWVGILLLLVTSFLIITTPPLAAKTLFAKHAISQGVDITFAQDSRESDMFLVNMNDLRTSNVVVTLTNDEKSIGPIVTDTEERSPGEFVFPMHALSPAGNWKVHVNAQRPNLYDAVADFSIDYPKDIQPLSAEESSHRPFDGFTVICIIAGFGTLVTAFLMYRFNEMLEKKCEAYSAAEEAHVAPERLNASYLRIISVVGMIAIGGACLYLYTIALKSDFQALCEKNSHFWNQTVPMRAGIVTSPVAVTGCSVGAGKGQFHFADFNEYQYFLRPAEAFVQMTMTPAAPSVGTETKILFDLKDSEGNPVRDLVVEHDRLLHTIIVGEDASVFSHIHSEDQGITPEMIQKTTFPVRYTFPKAGRYLIAADFTVRAQHFSQEFVVAVTGAQKMGAPPEDTAREHAFDGYAVKLSAPATIKAGALISLNYHIEKDGAPATDLEPYLSAPMHLAIVRSDLGSFSHNHGELPQSLLHQLTTPAPTLQNYQTGHSHGFLPDHFGPDITALAYFPQPGLYWIFGEFKHGGTVTVTRFEVEAQ